MRRTLRLIAIVSACLLMTGCSSSNITPIEQKDYTLPHAESIYPAPRGYDSFQYEATVALYLPSLDQQRLLPQYAQFTLSRLEHSAETVARQLLAYPTTDTVRQLGGDVSISLYGEHPVEISDGVCTVNLGSSALRLTEEEFYTLSLSLSSTLCQLDGIQYVNVLVANKPVGLDIAGYLPLGTLTSHTGEVLPTLWRQIENRGTPLGHDPAQCSLNAMATLYFPLQDGSGFMAEARSISFAGQTPTVLASKLVDELFLGAQTLKGACPMGELSKMLLSAETSEQADGSRMITLYFMPELVSRLEQQGIDPACFTGAVTYTLTSFIPSVTAVRMFSGATLLTSLYSPALGTISFQNGIQRRSQYASALREHVQVYLAREGRLEAVERSVASESAHSPVTLMALLMEGPTAPELRAGFLPVLPSGFDSGDVLGFGVVDDTLLLNLSERFGSAIRRQVMNEQLLCYSMVTTLCEAQGLRRVRFYFAGDMEQDMGGSILWGGEFMLNRMLIVP